MWGKWKVRALAAEEKFEGLDKAFSAQSERWVKTERHLRGLLQDSEDEVAELRTELQTGQWMLKLLEAQNGSASTIAAAVGEAVANSVRAAFSPSAANGEQPVVDLSAIQDEPYEETDMGDWTDMVFPDGVMADRQDAAVIAPGESIIPGLARPDMSGEELGL